MKKCTAPRLEAFSGLPKEAMDAYLPRAHRHTPKMIGLFRHSRECRDSVRFMLHRAMSIDNGEADRPLEAE